MQTAMKQSLGAQMKSEEAQRMYDTVMPRVNAVIREELSWAAPEARLRDDLRRDLQPAGDRRPDRVYQGPIGSVAGRQACRSSRAVDELMQRRMDPLMQKVMQVTKEEVEKERARTGKKS